MYEKVDSIFDECIDMIHHYGRCLVKDSSECIRSDLEEISPFMMDLCDTRTRFLTTQNIFSDYIQEIDASDKPEVDGVTERFEADVEKTISKLLLGEKNEAYLEFRKSFLLERSSLDDSEIATVSEAINTIDPITRLTLTDPVKNIKCGHVYEKSSILHLIKQKSSVKCPIPGCIAAECVNKDDLIPHVALKRYLDQNQKSE